MIASPYAPSSARYNSCISFECSQTHENDTGNGICDPELNIAEGNQKLFSTEHFFAAANFFKSEYSESSLKNRKPYNQDIFLNDEEEFIDSFNLRVAILGKKSEYIENNSKKIVNCILKLRSLKSGNVDLDRCAISLAHFIEKESNETFNGFKKFSYENISDFHNYELYKKEKDSLDQFIDKFPILADEINQKIEQDAKLLKASSGVYNQVLEAFSAFSFTLINIAGLLQPQLLVFCTVFSIVVGVTLFLVRLYSPLKNCISFGKEDVLAKADIGKIKECILEIQQFGSLDEKLVEKLVEKYYVFELKKMAAIREAHEHAQQQSQTQIKMCFIEIHEKLKEIGGKLENIDGHQIGILDHLSSMASDDTSTCCDSLPPSRPSTPSGIYPYSFSGRKGSVSSTATAPPSPSAIRKNPFDLYHPFSNNPHSLSIPHKVKGSSSPLMQQGGWGS